MNVSCAIIFISLSIVNLLFFAPLKGREENQDTAPEVKILMPQENKTYKWKDQVRYSIGVSDPKDGESKYGEIPSQQCLLNIEYLPVTEGHTATDMIQKVQHTEEHPGLSLMKRSTCFGCHADKNRVAGPSFQEIAARYPKDAKTINSLGMHIRNGSSGVWGDPEMPAHPDFTEAETKLIASYILEEGGDPNRWVYAGLEGAFTIIEKPANDTEGIYLLTASYTSKSGSRGYHSIALKIK
jgi:cytochrome c